MTKPTKFVGRINYALRILLVTAMAFALEVLGGVLLHLDRLPHYAYDAQWLIVIGLFVPSLLTILDGRIHDSNSPRWLKYPALIVWISSISIPVIWPHQWLLGLGSFALLLAVGSSLPSGPSIKEYVAPHQELRVPRSPHPVSVDRNHPAFPSRLLVGQLSFARSLLTLAFLWIPLIWLANSSGWVLGVWVARFGYSILAIVWFFKFLGRLADAGKLPRARYGYLAIGGALLIGLLSHVTWREGPIVSNIASIASGWLKGFNGDEMLALFVAIQIPLILSVSKSERSVDKAPKREKAEKTNELACSGPLEFFRILLVLSCAFIPLIYMDHSSGGNTGSWIARVGYLVVGCFWLIFSNGRLEDAGWGHNSYPTQYFLVVCILSLMPLAYKWVNAYGAVAIFFLIQVPTVFLPSWNAEGEAVSPDTSNDTVQGGAYHT